MDEKHQGLGMTGRPIRKTVVITGAARRLGRALALDFARRGWKVAAHVHHRDNAAEELVREISDLGGTAEVFAADLSDIVAVEALIPTVVQRLGKIGCIVNNASLFEYDSVETLSSSRWDAHFAVNLRAPVFLIKAFAAQVSPSECGVAVNILDQRVWKPTPHYLSYACAKSGLWSMTQMLAQGLAPRIRVNAIGPGPMLQSVHQTEADFRAQYLATPLQRPASPEEIAAAVRFIIDAPSLTGQMLALDNGQHLAWQTPDIGDGRG